MTAFTLCVYCGSRAGARPTYAELARQVGAAIGRRGWRMVYGGGRAGLMGIAADAALAHGAHVIGVIPDSLMRLEVGHHGLSELHVVDSMHQRKQMMAERADAFVALPGGIGTFEELFEVWTWRHLGYHDRPLGLMEAEGYWAPLVQFLDRTKTEGFISETQMAMLHVDDDVERLLDAMAARGPAPRPSGFGQI
ncbi:MAG: TIGR00730 family Rossman fold protein [Burkholderiales bacterium]|nr:TIGR00730 family Rossman fold protein [Burkholderiales bacterium]